MKSSGFEVDKKGLGQIAARRPPAFSLLELIANCYDAPEVTEVYITLKLMAGRPWAELEVVDNCPEGFKNLAHAWTLFAESEKKGDAEKRGRFNLGEKLVLSLCDTAEIITTTGGVRFDDEGRHTLRTRREKGSSFKGTIRMTRAEYEEVCEEVFKIIPPANVATYFNGKLIPQRTSVGVERVVLPTELPDEEGYIRRTRRNTTLRMYEPFPGEVGTLYELGIPVMETGDRYHVDVAQKVPLNMERDGVSPAYLRAIRAATLNNMWQALKDPEEAAQPWVRDAVSSPDITGAAVERVMDARFGLNRVVYDPSDKEANSIAMSKGMTVVPGAALSKEEWSNVRRFEAVKPAGQVTPSPKPFTPGGKPLELVPPEQWSRALKSVVAYYTEVAGRLVGQQVTVVVTDSPFWPFAASYEKFNCRVTLNYGATRADVESRDLEALNDLLIHELAHHYESDHLAEKFHEACCTLGAKMVNIALADPELFKL